MKKAVLAVSTVVLLVALGLVFGLGCGEGKPRLYIYNWTYYIPDDVIKDFQKRYGVRVIYDMYASNEEMYAKLKIGGANYDLVFPSGDHVTLMAREGMLKEIDKSRVPVFEYFDEAIISRITFDPGSKYSVPYAVGSAGISVNTAKVKNFDRTWRGIFENPELRGRFTMLDDMREVMGAALRTLGYSVNSIDTAQLMEARDLVMEWRKGVVKFDSEAFGKGFAAGEFWATHGYAENVFTELDESAKKDAVFFVPQEGGPMYIDNFVILKDAKNIDLAYQFINFIHEPEIYARIMDEYEIPSLNVPARKHMKQTPHYQIEDLTTSEFKEDLGEHLELYNKIWQEIRVGR